jgi:rhodanese-related sulfurtransferase
MAWFALARDTVLLGLGAVVLGAISLAVRQGVPWIAPPPPPEPTACGLDEAIAIGDEPARPELARVGVADLSDRLAGVVVIDARSSDAFVEGHIPGAISMPADEIDALVASQSLPLPVDRDIVAYCDREGEIDALYVGVAIDTVLGCGRVHVLEGGFAAWLAAQAPIEGAGRSG